MSVNSLHVVHIECFSQRKAFRADHLFLVTRLGNSVYSLGKVYPLGRVLLILRDVVPDLVFTLWAKP
jgi:hypothetical protein